MPTDTGAGETGNTIEALGEALDATPQQQDALRAVVNENKRRNAAIFLTPSSDGSPAPAFYISEQIALGIDMDAALGRGLIANYLAACTGTDGVSHLEALGQSNRASLAAACEVLTAKQAQLLRSLLPDGLSTIETGLDAMGEAMREALRPSTFATWVEFARAAAFPTAVEARLRDEFVVLKEQLCSVLQAVPAEGGESPLEYQARLVAAGDPAADIALDTYLASRTDPVFQLRYREVLQRAERERMLRIVQHLEPTARGQFRRLWRQSVMSIRLPGDRFDAVLTRKIQAIKSQRWIDHAKGMSPLPWADFCRGLLLTSAQEAALRGIIHGLQAEQSVPAALAAEAGARALIAAQLSPAQLRQWSAFAQRSLFTVQVAA